MRGVVLALLVDAACYSPPIPRDAPCTTDDQCLLDQRCILGRCSAGDTPPPPDGGGSGSGCVLSGPQDPDEDGDRLPDRCDPCPLLAGNATTDSDSDGLPDACDPNLTAATSHKPDSTWLIEGFRSQPIWAGLGFTLGSDSNSLKVEAPGGANPERIAVLPLPVRTSYDDFRVTAAIRVTAVTGGDPAIGLWLTDPATLAYAYCQLVQEGSNTSARFLDMSVDTPTGGGGSSPPFAWAVNTDYTLELRGHGTILDCTIKGGTITPPAPQSALLPMTPIGGMTVMIAAYAVTATVNWVYVVGSP